MKKRLFIILVILGVIALTGWYFGFSGTGREEERFIVYQETGQEKILADLEEKNFYRNRKVFQFFLKHTGKDISPGAYLVSGRMNAYQLAKVLTSLPYQKWVTIPPAKRKEQVALILARALDWPKEKTIEFIKIAKEGWLYADTYLINTDYDAAQTYQKLYSTFNEKLDSALQKTLLEKNIRLDTAVKFASLIEKEFGSEEDRKIISAIIWNRVEKGMRLEIDATVQYGLSTQNCRLSEPSTENWSLLDSCDFWPHLSGKDIRTADSPYNTYFNNGLPPGPICSPSIASFWAVALPAETDALYYLHANGQIYTARTYAQHLKNIKRYLN